MQWRVVGWGMVGLLALVAGGCGDSVEEAGNVAESCGERACPNGTAFSEKRSFRGGTDVSAGVDVTQSSGEGAFASFGEGDCEYVCQAIQDCPATTFPIITQTCFTCGVILPNDTVDRGGCPEG